jgi:DNA ligase D-like protein (predicted 3'-phosphoesterase)
VAQNDLQAYREKRDFLVTPEPSGDLTSLADAIFVVQKHSARSLHYDFRLQVGGVLKSWAVPKGPSSNPADKRLAMPTEDHPLGYAGFEGVIPEGQYGAGPVIVWDNGTYRNITEADGETVPIERALENGHAAFWLDGEKLKGGYALTQVSKGKRARWILVKMRDDEVDDSRDLLDLEPRSVISGRTIEDMETKTD